MANSHGIHEKLERARRDLLDLSTRNRLLSTARSSTRSSRLEIVDETSDKVFRTLVQEKKSMVFMSGKSEEDDEGQSAHTLNQPDESSDEFLNDRSQAGLRLRTRLNSETLQRRLLKLYYDARTFEEEQGVNSLYLAIGFLKWYEDDKSDRERHAPLLLIPVQLDRRSVASRFQLKYTDDDITTNLSLQEKLRIDFGIRLPDVPEIEDLNPDAYFALVREEIKAKPRWEILPNDIVLWFFSFSKFLMYRDLQPATWLGDRRLEQHPLIDRLLNDGFEREPPLRDEDDNIDGILQPLDMIHVMDADSSQAITIEEIKRGRSLVVQGPPGTGKSQTITNLIATAVKEHKKVLFVAEKMAALEVVKRRLDNIGLGDMCLEMHSHKANKRAVLEELGRTLDLGRPKVGDGEVANQAEQLRTHRDRLNRHAKIMHGCLEPARVTPFQALGELVSLRSAGVPPGDFELLDALRWSEIDFQARERMLQDLVLHMQELGNSQQHPWRGVCLEAILPTDIDRLRASLRKIIERLERLTNAASELAGLLEYGSVKTALDAATVAQLANRIVKAPPMDRRCIGDDVWETRREAIDSLIETGKRLVDCRTALRPSVAGIGWTTDVTKARRNLAAYGRSWLRLFYRDYREAQTTLSSILAIPAPKALNERLWILDRLIEGQQALHVITTDPSVQELGRRAFGDQWRGVESDWSALAQIARWEAECRGANIPSNFRALAARMEDVAVIGELLKQIAVELKPSVGEIQSLFQSFKLDLSLAFGENDVRTISLAKLKQRLEVWQDHPEAVTKWIAYHLRWRRLESQGMGALVERLDQGRIALPEALVRFRMVYFEQIMREAFRRYPELAEFDGMSHDRVLERFRALDCERIDMARHEVTLAHYWAMPTDGGNVGEVGVVRREMKKQRRHLPLRKLLQQAGHAVQAIKPVFMMSPVSVAQYLEPGVLEFDLLLIDEASQVRPVDALGAIARARQVVVVGDNKQLPPTSFFSHVVEDEDDEKSADEFQAQDTDSILRLCEAQNMSQRMLRWHYRSRHHSLIAVSNREFYEDKLFVAPSPYDGGSQLGLVFHHVADGVFDRGGSKTNRVEARAVADAVMRHARLQPGKSLGVGAFSVSQRDAILDEVELRRRETSDLETFFATSREEPFFVKNLENIQGDERDVILISVGYGKDSSGFMGMNFGPLNNEGGERRLNVLITRAKERCEVFSSIIADDIDLNRSNARGVQALKAFLAYARTGILGVAVPTDREHDSEFERQVAHAVARQGYKVVPQVGVAGFFVDLAVVDPDHPGRYLLGIECDGAAYHSSRSARDRDRLRQQVLEDRDWVIHRIWSTDWFHRPEDQLRKVIAAIEQAKAIWTGRDAPKKNSPTKVIEETQAIDRHEPMRDAKDSGSAIRTVPYQEARFKVGARCQVHEVPISHLATVVTQVVRIEGPVHQDEVARRVASLWGLKRTGRRITEAVEAALDEAAYSGQIVRSGLFFQPANQQSVPIRNRGDVGSANLRKAEFLPSIEVQTALMAIVQTHLGVRFDELATEVSRLFGFKSTSAQLRQMIQDEVTLLIEQKMLVQRNGTLYVSDGMIGVRA